MVAAVVLALGSIFIYEALFTSLDAFNHYFHYLYLSPWADEKIWDAQEGIRLWGMQAQISPRGAFKLQGKEFAWELVCGQADASLTKGLYNINLDISWFNGPRKVTLHRSAYAIYKQ